MASWLYPLSHFLAFSFSTLTTISKREKMHLIQCKLSIGRYFTLAAFFFFFPPFFLSFLFESWHFMKLARQLRDILRSLNDLEDTRKSIIIGKAMEGASGFDIYCVLGGIQFQIAVEDFKSFARLWWWSLKKMLFSKKGAEIDIFELGQFYWYHCYSQIEAIPLASP